MSSRKPPQGISDELDALFEQFAEQEGYDDDSIFDMQKYDLFLQRQASAEAYRYWSSGSKELDSLIGRQCGFLSAHLRMCFFRGKKEEKRMNYMMTMDDKAIDIVRGYIREHLDKSDGEPRFEVFIVWKCKTLQNWKYLLSSTLFDGMYYELTYNGDKEEWYLDAYKKFENRVVKG